MLTINAEIKSDGKRLDGTYNVKLRFTLDRKIRRQGTSLFATPSDLTKDLRRRQAALLGATKVAGVANNAYYASSL